MKKQTLSLLSAVAVAALVGTFATPAAAERVVKIAGFGAKSGIVRSFGINTEAVMQAAVEHINGQGGVKLGDGTMAMIEMSFDDDRCNAEEGISVLRKIASSDALVAVGADLLERGRAPVRHPPAQRGRCGRFRPPDPGIHGHRDQGRPREDLRVGVPQRSQRERDVPHPVPLGEGELPRPRDGVRRGGRGLRPLALHLVRGDGQAGRRKPGSRSWASPSGCSRTRTSPSRYGR